MSDTKETSAPPTAEGSNGGPVGEGAQGGEGAGDDTQAKLAKTEKERAELHDRLLRLAAEFENHKKRSRREIDDAGTRGREQLLKEILPVIDNLERAIHAAASGGTVESLAEGVKLVDKQLHSTLEKFQVKRFDALGETFDPSRHEAIQQVESAEYAPGSVAQVFAKGYTIGDRLLRPAMVAVAKAPAGAPPDGGNGGAKPEDVMH